MIEIKRTYGADTRSCKKDITKEDLLESTEQHIDDVRKAIMWMIMELFMCSSKHDYTKVKFIDEFYNDFVSKLKDGGNFKDTDWYKMHITTERHHIDKVCPDNVNLFDILEHIADVVMAGLSRTGKFYDDEIDPDVLMKAYENTINQLKNNVKVIE